MFLRILSFPDLEKGMASGSWRSAPQSGGVAANPWVQLGQATLRPIRSGATEQLISYLGQYSGRIAIAGAISGIRPNSVDLHTLSVQRVRLVEFFSENFF